MGRVAGKGRGKEGKGKKKGRKGRRSDRERQRDTPRNGQQTEQSKAGREQLESSKSKQDGRASPVVGPQPCSCCVHSNRAKGVRREARGGEGRGILEGRDLGALLLGPRSRRRAASQQPTRRTRAWSVATDWWQSKSGVVFILFQYYSIYSSPLAGLLHSPDRPIQPTFLPLHMLGLHRVSKGAHKESRTKVTLGRPVALARLASMQVITD